MRRNALVAALTVWLVSVACSSSTGSGNSGSTLPVPALKLRVLQAVGGQLAYCDPDMYPLAHGTPISNAKERLPEIRSHADIYRAILSFEHIGSGAAATDDQLVAINEDYKQIQAIQLKPEGDGFAFAVNVPSNADEPVAAVSGSVSRTGQVKIEGQKLGQRPACPICLARGVLISTPSGPVPVQDMRVGMGVWTTDREGHRTRGVVLQVGHTLAPIGHRVVRVTLADGRVLVASPGHPTADGRPLGDLRVGDTLGGSRVTSIAIVPYMGEFTYDLLPSGSAGTYFANGVVLASTLR
jgi:hypothetical protein